MAQKKWLNFADYQRALEQVLVDLPPVIIVEGEEEHLRHRAIEMIQHKLRSKYPEIAEVQFFGPEVVGEGRFDFAELLVELGSASLFASEKIITFRRAQRSLFIAGSAAGNSRITPQDSLLEYIKKPSLHNYFIIEVEKINRQRVLGKVLAKEAIIPCPVLGRQGDIITWMKSEARQRQKELSAEAALVLYRAHGSELGIIAAEIEKLVNYVGKEHSIGVEDVQKFLSGSVEFSIFELIDAVERRDLSKALYYVRLLCEQGSKDQSGKRQDGLSSAHQALALIAATLENLIQIRALIAEQLVEAEIIKELGLYPKRAEKLIRSASAFTLSELAQALNILTLEMKSAHDTGADPKLSLERVVLAICCSQKPVSLPKL